MEMKDFRETRQFEYGPHFWMSKAVSAKWGPQTDEPDEMKISKRGKV